MATQGAYVKDRAPLIVLLAVVTIALVLLAGEVAYRDWDTTGELP